MKLVGMAAALAVVCAAPRAYAWEPETTQAGLAEQAALASRLHRRLVMLGFDGGLFEPLTIPPADAQALLAALKLLSPTHGSVPDARGRQTALAWLAAGAAIADIPASHGANHFYDPSTRRGWMAPSRTLVAALTNAVRQAVGRSPLPPRGIPAPDWVVAKDNPFNVDAFYAQYAKAVSAATPGERSRHMAAALVAAGATLHALGDLGAPSRVRGDEAAHLEFLGGGPDDLGSRFERLAALSFGRLGVPAPSRLVTRTHLREFFTAVGTAVGTAGGHAPEPSAGSVMPPPVVAGTPLPGEGLADLIARSYFSAGTLPRSARIAQGEVPALVRPAPAVPSKLALVAASHDEGVVLRNAAEVCLARYAVEAGVLTFTTDDACMLEQITAILPEVAAFETGLLEFLLRGELTVTIADGITVAGAGLAMGELTVVVEDTRGVRTVLGTMATPAAGATGATLATLARPTAGVTVYAVYRGTDAAGEPIVAVGAAPIPHE